jgi:hypothetical protein
VTTRVLLKGPAIEPLLAQVREEHGSGVRIVSADKVRSGGIGGFFAKQHYELFVEVPDTVEVPDSVAAPKSVEVTGVKGAAPGPDAAFAELVAGLDVADQIAASVPARTSPRAKAVPVKTEAVQTEAVEIVPVEIVPVEIVPAKAEEPPAVRPPRPAPATGTPADPPVVRPPVQSLAELMGGLAVSPVITPAEAKAVRPAPADVATPLSAPVIRNLVSVGMPEAMAARITGGDTYAAVLAALATRPAPPGMPDGSGDVLVLAGDLSQALAAGTELLARAGLDETHLLPASRSTATVGPKSEPVMRTATDAAAAAEELRTSGSASIVVLDAPVGGTDPAWVGEMCAAIGATAVWALVDATRKTADTARHLRILGDVEALVVHGVELTGDPGSVLGLDLPVVSLDGKPATPHTWAALLCARIATDVAPPAVAPRRPARPGR